MKRIWKRKDGAFPPIRWHAYWVLVLVMDLETRRWFIGSNNNEQLSSSSVDQGAVAEGIILGLDGVVMLGYGAGAVGGSPTRKCRNKPSEIGAMIWPQMGCIQWEHA